MAHDSLKPHNILGDGTITKCPPDCPEHERWKEAQREHAQGLRRGHNLGKA